MLLLTLFHPMILMKVGGGKSAESCTFLSLPPCFPLPQMSVEGVKMKKLHDDFGSD